MIYTEQWPLCMPHRRMSRRMRTCAVQARDAGRGGGKDETRLQVLPRWERPCLQPEEASGAGEVAHQPHTQGSSRMPRPACTDAPRGSSTEARWPLGYSLPASAARPPAVLHLQAPGSDCGCRSAARSCPAYLSTCFLPHPGLLPGPLQAFTRASMQTSMGVAAWIHVRACGLHGRSHACGPCRSRQGVVRAR